MQVGELLDEAYIGVPYASWELWNPKAYLETYFKKLGPDSIETFRFLIKELKYIDKKIGLRNKKILDFGSGPTIFTAMLVAEYASELHLADYLFSNLAELKKWINKKRDSFNWQNLIKVALKMEGRKCNKKDIAEREELIRGKTRLFRCDASLSLPLGSVTQYPLVVSTFCADSATSSKEIWRIFSKNIINLVEPGGYVLISALRKCTYYKNGTDIFPCADIDEVDFRDLLNSLDFEIKDENIVICEVPECAQEGFSSLLFIRAQRGEYKFSKPFRKKILQIL